MRRVKSFDANRHLTKAIESDAAVEIQINEN